MKNYPVIDVNNKQSIDELLEFIVKERKKDVDDFNNLTNVFISGRKVGKIPTGATDIDIADRIGDFNYDTSYIYIVVDNGGTAEWRRATLASW
jgi:hypothetical protein